MSSNPVYATYGTFHEIECDVATVVAVSWSRSNYGVYVADPDYMWRLLVAS